MAAKVITVNNVNKSYGPLRAINKLSFEVEEASCFGLLGPNGAGKTTMMKIIYGKGRRDDDIASSVSVFGFDPAHKSLEIRAMAGVVPQDNNLDTGLNVVENLRIYARFYGIPARDAELRIDSLLEFMELTDKKNAMTRELSGGMQRRLIIARALLNRPRLLILDEPTTGLDPQVRHLIWDKLLTLKKEGVTMLLTTHYMEEAFQICDQIIIMHKGEKVLAGVPHELIEKNIEKYALQVVKKQQTQPCTDNIDGATVRKEESEQLVVYYSDDMRYLENIAECLPASDFHIRQSNLEDLFLKATGRGLNEG
jgi:lipooligosaccharide transport system ATP-binding protein